LYHQDPIAAIKQSLDELQNNPVWEKSWEDFMGTMVYGSKPKFKEAITTLLKLSETAIAHLQD
jgi:hypothetical protein